MHACVAHNRHAPPYGRFYADFFLPRDTPSSERAPVYEGIYRYVNNPEVVLGKLYFYGIAVLTLSMEVGARALAVARTCHMRQLAPPTLA